MIEIHTTAKIAPTPVKIAISPRDMGNPPSNYQRRMSSTLFYADLVSSRRAFRLHRRRFELLLMMIDMDRMMEIALR
jgi:hypothetical protein